MRKSIHRLLCGFVALAVVLSSICLPDTFFGLAAKTVSAESNIQFKPNAIGILDPLRYLKKLGSPGANIITLAAAGEATTVSAASLQGGPLAVGSLAAGFGNGLASTTETAPDGQFPPTILAGATVTVFDTFGDAYPARILYASPTQINHEIPVNAFPGPATIIYSNTVTQQQSTSSVNLSSVSPGNFSLTGTGSGVANALLLRKLNGVDRYESVARTENGQIVPIPIEFGPPEEVLVLALFGTGFRFRSSLSNMTLMIGGIPHEVIYAGPAGSGQVAIDQLNVILSRSLAGRGLVDIFTTLDGFTSNTVQLSFR